MNWRGLRDVVLRRVVPPDSERSIKAIHLDRLAEQVSADGRKARSQKRAASERLAAAIRKTTDALKQ